MLIALAYFIAAVVAWLFALQQIAKHLDPDDGPEDVAVYVGMSLVFAAAWPISALIATGMAAIKRMAENQEQP